MNFEIHVTTYLPSDLGKERFYNRIAKAEGWSTSKIAGDPALGDGIKFYFTTYALTDTKAFIKLNNLTDRLRDERIKILREKIEHVIFDTKYKIGTDLQ